MIDEHLRELERRWRASGTVADEAAYMVERVRAGELASEKVLASAKLGHTAAMMVIGHADARQWLSGQSLIDTLGGFGSQSLARASLIILDRLSLEMGFGVAAPPLVRALTGSARAWLANPNDELAARVERYGHDCSREALTVDQFGQVIVHTPGLPGLLLELADILGRIIRGCDSGEAVLYTFLVENRGDYPCLYDRGVRTLLCEWLVPWLLGYSDPLNIGAPKAGSS